MQDDNSKISDDDLIEDFDDEIEDLDDMDFEDLDEELGEDFVDDESWDELDQVDEGDAPAKAAKSKKSGSFLQKNFNLIVIGVVAVGGGLFAYGQLGGGSAPQTAMPAVESTDAVADGMPPMPAPMDSSAELDLAAPEEEIDLSLESLPEEPALLEDNALTPLPGASDESDELLPLELEDTSGDELADLEETPMDEQVELSAPEDDFTLDMIDTSEEEGFSLSEAVEQVQSGPDLSLEEPMEVESDELTMLGADDPVVEEAAVEPEPIVMQEELTAAVDSAEIDALQAEFKDREGALLAEKDALSADLSDANKEIASLEGTVSSLEEKVASLTKSLEKMEKDASSAAKETRTPPKAAPVAKPKPVSKAPVAKEPAIVKVDWELRSAQPGQAMIADKATQNVRTVKVGDTVPGLGEVTSVAVEGGLWVVRGTSGIISQ